MSSFNPGPARNHNHLAAVGLGVAAAVLWSACQQPPPSTAADAQTAATTTAVGDTVTCRIVEQGAPVDVQGQVQAIQGDQASVAQAGQTPRWVPISTCTVTQAAAPAAAATTTGGIAAGQHVYCRVQEAGGVTDVHGQVQDVQGEQVQVAAAGAAPRWLYAGSCQVEEAPAPAATAAAAPAPTVAAPAPTAAAPAPAAPAGALAPGQNVYCRVQEGGGVVDIHGQVQAVNADQVQVAAAGAAPRWLYAYSCKAEAAAPAPAAPAAGFRVGETVLCRRPGLPEEYQVRIVSVQGDQVSVQYDTGYQETIPQVRCRRDTRAAPR